MSEPGFAPGVWQRAGVRLHASPFLKRFSASSQAQPCGAPRKGLGLTRRWGFASGLVSPRGDGGGTGGREMREGRGDPRFLPCCTFPWDRTWLTSAQSTALHVRYQKHCVVPSGGAGGGEASSSAVLSSVGFCSKPTTKTVCEVSKRSLYKQSLCSALHLASSACTTGVLAQGRARGGCSGP